MWNDEAEYLIRPDREAVSAPNGFYELSGYALPQRQANSLRRILVAVLLLAGLMGGAFQAVQALRLAVTVMAKSHRHTHHR